MKQRTKHIALINGSNTEDSCLLLCINTTITAAASGSSHHLNVRTRTTLSMAGGLGAGVGDVATGIATTYIPADTRFISSDMCQNTNIQL